MTDAVARDGVPPLRFEGVEMVFAPGIRMPVRALTGFSMEVAEGAVVGLLGPNGSGKTTAISCALGLLRPQRGCVRLWGDEVDGRLPAGPEKRIGVLLEDTRLPPFLSVRDALACVCAVRGLKGKAVRTELDRVIAEARIQALLERKVAVLSKGQARRVGLASALLGDPPLLVLDEPSAGLDVSAREEFNELVRGLRAETRTVLIASHLLSDIESTCTHVAIIQGGRILVYEAADKLLRDARAREAQKDIYVEEALCEQLASLGVRSEASRYPGLVRLICDGPEYELIGRLAAERIVPARIEPRVNLVSVYLDVTGRATE